MRRTVLNVEGVSCPSCISHIGETLRNLSGVGHVEVRLHEGTVLVQHDPKGVDVHILVAVLRDAGYEANSA